MSSKNPSGKKNGKVKRLNLALQGGGAHGAYSWGVLDRLLEEEDVEIVGISGTSAGAMNAAVLAHGLVTGGREAAKEQLRMFWQRISDYSSVFSPIQQTPWEQLMQGFNLNYSAAYSAYDMLSRFFSPYDLNPFNYNPLRDILGEMIDFDRLHECDKVRVFVTATSVETGYPRVFKEKHLTLDALLASACLPTVFQAVEIDGEPYWDGGYMGNPTIWPLIYHTDCRDVLLVEINPIYREGTPRKAVDIMNRLNEISFNSSLIAEMRAIHFVKKLIARGLLDDTEYKDVLMHRIELPDGMQTLTASSKFNADWDFFVFLHQVGREAAEHWIAGHKADVNLRSTVDIEAAFLANRYALKQKTKEVAGKVRGKKA